jgi:hypothetical protein
MILVLILRRFRWYREHVRIANLRLPELERFLEWLIKNDLDSAQRIYQILES